MTVLSLYKSLCQLLNDNRIEDSALEARYIIEHILGISYSDFLLNGNTEISAENSEAAEMMALHRITGVPLQYIIGEWDFMGFTFKVGEGVLIPRPETEILCEYVVQSIKDIPSPVVYDLCSGTGCIGIAIKKLCPNAQVTLIEKSHEALKYLRENCKNLCQGNEPSIIQGDITCYNDFDFLGDADVIVSNPPYIKSRELPFLQKEVQHEPAMALDGGEDGLMFYRCLVNSWSNKLKDSGLMAFECAEEQSGDIVDLFKKINFDTTVINDYNNIQRIVTGRRKSNAF